MSKYFRAPLAAIAYRPKDPAETLGYIFAWCSVEVGRSMFSEVADAELLERAIDENSEEYARAAPQGRDELMAYLGARHLNIVGSSPSYYFRAYCDLESYLCHLDKASVANKANVSAGWLWACVNTLRGNEVERTMSFREFRILWALLSKVGSSKYAKCGWQEIQARAAGWCGKKAMREASSAEKARRKPLLLTRNMIRTTLARLEADKFFARVQWDSHESWFSFSCGSDRGELIKWISNMKARRLESLGTNREADDRAAEEVRKRKGLVPPLKAPSQQSEEKNDHHSTTTINGNDEKSTTINDEPKREELPPPPSHPTTTDTTTGPPPLTKNNLNGNNLNDRTTINDALTPSGEDGYSIEGRFLTSEQASRLMAENPARADEVWKLFTPARRFTDGRVITCVKA